MTKEDIHVALGSYDAEVSGLRLWEDSEGLLSMEVRYAYRPHADSVTCLCFDGYTLASGSVDETVRIYDVISRREGVILMGHQGTVNELQWARDDSGSYLLSGGEDGVICVWRKKGWRRVKELKGSGSAVTGMAVHPSSKVVVSIGRDGKMNMWDLVKGKIAFSAKLKVQVLGDCKAQWAPSGELYALLCGKSVAIYEGSGKLVRVLEHDRDVVDLDFLDNQEIVTAGNDKIVRLWDTRDKKEALLCATHDCGVAGVSAVSHFVVSGDSHGGLRVWDRRRGETRIATSFGHRMRLTCLDTVNPENAELNNLGRINKETEQTEANGRSDQSNRLREGDTASKRKRRKRKSQLREHTEVQAPANE